MATALFLVGTLADAIKCRDGGDRDGALPHARGLQPTTGKNNNFADLRVVPVMPRDAAVIGDFAIGLSYELAGGGTVLLWTVTGPYILPDLQPSHGDAETLDEAKQAFRAKYVAWLHWAVSRLGEATWNGWLNPETGSTFS